MTGFETWRAQPPLVFAGECDLLTERLARAARGEAFVLQGGDHSRSAADVGADAISARLRTLLQMAAILTYAAAVPVVKVGRIGPEFSAAHLNLVRALTVGGYADLRQVHAWNRDFVARSPDRARYAALAGEIDRALAFMRACGMDLERLSTVEFFAAHESRPGGDDAALTRVDSRTGLPYDTAGHFVWTGEAARAQADEHVAALRNPLGVELGPSTGPDDALRCLDRLDPAREPGRVTFLVRMGAAAVRDRLPALIEKVTAEDRQVAWICHPAPHARRADVLAELTAFFEVHRGLGTHPGGLTAELTGDDSAALDLAFRVAELCRG